MLFIRTLCLLYSLYFYDIFIRTQMILYRVKEFFSVEIIFSGPEINTIVGFFFIKLGAT